MILKDFLNIYLSIYTIPEIYLFRITLSKVKANITQDPTFLMEMKTFTSGHVVLENKDVLINFSKYFLLKMYVFLQSYVEPVPTNLIQTLV